MKIRFSLLLCIFISGTAYAQQIRPKSSAEIYKDINTLKHVPKVLYFAAHPDDENTGLLSWFVNEKQVETAYLSLTRGDGGQNLIGSEQGSSLGLIRTYELLEARKLDGAKQFFTRAIDFGFSKNPEDTFEQWPIDSVTADAVWVIRNFKPDIIICRFPPGSAAGHGQHSASAIIAEKAFRLAADPTAYPEQFVSVKPWQAKRLLWNTFRFGATNTITDDQFQVSMGQYDPLLGMGYGELAGVSRSLHRSQGAGTPSVAGIRTEHFQLVAGSPMENSLFDGISENWADLGHSEIDQSLASILSAFNFIQPDQSLPALLKLRKQIQESNEPSLKEKLTSLDKIILDCAGFMVEVVTGQREAVQGETLNFSLNAIARTDIPVALKRIKLFNQEENLQQELINDSLFQMNLPISIPSDAGITEPYWMAKPAETPSLYAVEKKELIGKATSPNELTLALSLVIDGQYFFLDVPLSFKKLDPIKGDVVEQLRIVPEVSIAFTQALYFPKTDADLPVRISLYANKDIHQGTLRISSAGKTLYTQANIKLVNQRDTSLSLSIPKELLASATQGLQASFQSENVLYTRSKHIIEYGHLPTLQYFTPATASLMQGELNVSVTKVGYVQGAGDFIPEFLRLAGVQVTVLQESDFISSETLSNYDAIISGVRSLNAEPRMKAWMPLLHQFVRQGGTLVMQFNTLQDLSTNEYGPYPFSIGRDRVTQENSKVSFLNPKHRMLNYPNTIRQEDFEGWVQERGLYFPSQWDKAYEPIFEMHDTDEKALQGGTLYAAYGKGHYIYSPLSFFRQLPAGNMGASKLFFNMLSIGK